MMKIELIYLVKKKNCPIVVKELCIVFRNVYGILFN